MRGGLPAARRAARLSVTLHLIRTRTHTTTTQPAPRHAQQMIAALPLKPEDIKTTPFPLLVKDRGF